METAVGGVGCPIFREAIDLLKTEPDGTTSSPSDCHEWPKEDRWALERRRLRA